MERLKINTSVELERLVRDQIMEWEKPSAAVLKELLGECAPQVFDFLYTLFEGQKRSDCDNPVIAHFYDVPIIVKRLTMERFEDDPEGFNNTIKCGALHDVLEDSTSNLEGLEERYKQVASRFGQVTANNVMNITNIFSFIIDNMIMEMDIGLDSKPGLIKALDYQKDILSSPIRDKYGSCFDRIKKIANEVTIDEVRELKKESRFFNYVTYVKLRCYKELYISSIVNRAKNELANGNPDYDIPLIIKAADGVDASYTMAPAKNSGAGKIIKKNEIKIDVIGDFIACLENMGLRNQYLVDIEEYLKYSLIESIRRRIDSAQALKSARYKPFEKFFISQFERLEKKYGENILVPTSLENGSWD